MLINTRTYNLDRYNSPDSVTYAAPTSTPAQKDVATLSRTYPKSGGSVQVSKPYFKMTKSVVVNATTGERKDLIIFLGGSVPVGTASTDVDDVLADIAAFAASADAKALFKSLDINA